MSQPDWVIELLDRLDPALYEDWSERTAIMYIDGKISPVEYAECLALLCILRNHPDALMREKQ